MPVVLHQPAIITPDRGYVASAVHFDGSAILSRVSLSAVDTPDFSMSLWLKTASAATSPTLFAIDPTGIYLSNSFPDPGTSPVGEVNITLTDAAGVNKLIAKSSISVVNGWHNIMVSASTNHIAGSKIIKVYVDDVDVTSLISDTDASFTPAFNGFSLYVGDDTLGDSLTGDLADVWIAPGVSLLTAGDILQATRRLFISETGKPVNPIGFPVSAVLFSGNNSGFTTNQGTGGAFTLTGSLTNASSSPSN